MRVKPGDPVELTLNTGRELALDAAALFIRGDRLYLRMDDEIARFNDRALLDMMPYLDETDTGVVVRIGRRSTAIPEETP